MFRENYASLLRGGRGENCTLNPSVWGWVKTERNRMTELEDRVRDLLDEYNQIDKLSESTPFFHQFGFWRNAPDTQPFVDAIVALVKENQ